MADGEDYVEKESIPDLYKYLGLTISVCDEPNCDEIIHKAYMRKALACHPDKHPGRKDVAEVFRLLTESYEILSTEKGRNSYNAKLGLSKQARRDFRSLKRESEAYHTESTARIEGLTPEFKEKMRQMDLDHGYDSSSGGVISKQDARKRLNDLTSTRSLQDQENLPENLFEGMPFNSALFNAAFDEYHKKEESIVPHSGVPSAWNEAGSVINYGAYGDSNNLYVNSGSRVDTQKQIYSEIDNDNKEKTRRLTKKDISNLKPASYVDNHSVLDDDYYANIKKKLTSRESATEKYNDMLFKDFIISDPETVEYRIHDQLYPDAHSEIENDETFRLTFEKQRDAFKKRSVLKTGKNKVQVIDTPDFSSA